MMKNYAKLGLLCGMGRGTLGAERLTLNAMGWELGVGG